MLLPGKDVTLRPLCSDGYVVPASSQSVGMMSTRWKIWLLSMRPPPSMPLGQWAIIGVAIPPSCTYCLYFRNGVLE